MNADKVIPFRIKNKPGHRMDMAEQIRKDIPDYDDPVLTGIVIPKGFSYPVGNMGDRHFLNLLSSDRSLRISIDSMFPFHRDNPEAPRFCIQERNEKGEYLTMVTSNDWEEIIFCLNNWD